MAVAHIDVFHRDPSRFWQFYGQRFQTLEDRQPNPAHRILAELEASGHVEAVITQNIDRLHARAGSRRLVEVHGSIAHADCLACGARYELAEVRGRHERAGDHVPRCDCGAPLKPGVVLFGEFLPARAMAEAEALASAADLLLCIGSSLAVYPVAELPAMTLQRGGQIALVTRGPTPYDARAAVKLAGDVVPELTAVAAALGLSQPRSGAAQGPGA
jgi:NAD-dependent deacetylase